MKFGLFDTKTNTWWGDGVTPKVFDSNDPLFDKFDADERVKQAALFARIAAELVDIQLRQQPHTTVHRVLPDDGAWRVHSEETPHMTTLQALIKKERGTVP